MDRREFLGALAGGLVAAQAAEAQQPGKVYHIGMTAMMRFIDVVSASFRRQRARPSLLAIPWAPR